MFFISVKKYLPAREKKKKIKLIHISHVLVAGLTTQAQTKKEEEEKKKEEEEGEEEDIHKRKNERRFLSPYIHTHTNTLCLFLHYTIH